MKEIILCLSWGGGEGGRESCLKMTLPDLEDGVAEMRFSHRRNVRCVTAKTSSDVFHIGVGHRKHDIIVRTFIYPPQFDGVIWRSQ